MAKRSTPRNQADDLGQAAEPKTSRPRGKRPPATRGSEPPGPAAEQREEVSNVGERRDERPHLAGRGEELPNIPEPGDAADRAQSESMASEPSEEDIRLRAYHRYLERGQSHGAHFDDWLEAERELKRKSRTSER